LKTAMNPLLQSELDKFEQYIVNREARKAQAKIAALGKALVRERNKFLISTGVTFVTSLTFILVIAVMLK